MSSSTEQYIIDSNQAGILDRYSIETLRIPSSVLMEEASERLYQAIRHEYSELSTSKIAVVAGKGNNGGDALSIARKLFFDGVCVNVICAENSGSEMYMVHLAAARAIGIPVILYELQMPHDFSQYDIIIDGIFGTGYHPPTPELYSSLITAVNASHKIIIAIDTPSGLYPDNFPIIQASSTYSIGYLKKEFYTLPLRRFAGEIRKIPIAIRAIVPEMKKIRFSIPKESVKTFTKNNDPYVHKYKRGALLIIGGSEGKWGAPAFAGKAAFAGGAGIVAVLTETENIAPIAQYAKELIYDQIDALKEYQTNYQTAVIGQGLAFRTPHAQEKVAAFIREFQGQLIFDASFFTLFTPSILLECKRPPLLTPHSGEFKRFFGEEAASLSQKSIDTVLALAEKYNCYLLLKDVCMLLGTPQGTGVVFDEPLRIAAQAGSGDILAGFLGGLQGAHKDLPMELLIEQGITAFYKALKKQQRKRAYNHDILIEDLNNQGDIYEEK